MTREKTRWMYNHYYHKKVMLALERIEAYMGKEVLYFILNYSNCSRKRWELIVKDYPDLVQDLIDN